MIKKVQRQAETEPASVEAVMRTAAFRTGVRDVRKRRPPRFDAWSGGEDWNYERGRLFATLSDLEVVSSKTGQLNPEAVAFCHRYVHEGDIG
jgi:hypothetical protein